MIARLVLSAPLRGRVAGEALAAFPRECCGLIEGVREGDAVRAVALHPSRNLAAGNDRFEIDPSLQFQLLHALRGSGREIVGCYHSHPNGRAYPSSSDRSGAGEVDFLWLIQPVGESGAGAPKAFVFDGGDFRAVALIGQCE